MWIENLHEGRLLERVRIDDTAVILAMLAAQQHINLSDEFNQLVCCDGFRRRLGANSVQLPATTRVFA